MRRCCWICWANNQDLGWQGRAVAEMIARIVGAYGSTVPSRGSVVLAVSGTQGHGAGRTGGQAGGLLLLRRFVSQPPRNRLPKRLPHKDRSCAEWSTLRPKRRTAEQLWPRARPDVRNSTAWRTSSFCVPSRARCRRWAPLASHPGDPVGSPGGASARAGSIDLRKTLRVDTWRDHLGRTVQPNRTAATRPTL